MAAADGGPAATPSPASSTTPPARPPVAPCSAPASAPAASARTAAGCRPRTRRSSSTPRTRRTARSPRRRCSPASAPRTCASSRPTTRTPCASTRWRRPSRDDLAAGRRPCAVVATVGTTATTALDPVRRHRRARRAPRPVAARRRGAGRHGHDLPGVPLDVGGRRARRLAWSSTRTSGWARASTSRAYFVRDPEHLVRVMSTDPSYLRTAQDGLVRNLRDWGIPLGRRFRALKLWFLLRDVRRRGPAGARPPRHRPTPLARGAGRRGRRTGSASRRCRCRPSACATSRRRSPATRTRSPPTTRRSPTASTAAGAFYFGTVAAQGPAHHPRLDRRRSRPSASTSAARGRRCGGGGRAAGHDRRNAGRRGRLLRAPPRPPRRSARGARWRSRKGAATLEREGFAPAARTSPYRPAPRAGLSSGQEAPSRADTPNSEHAGQRHGRRRVHSPQRHP